MKTATTRRHLLLALGLAATGLTQAQGPARGQAITVWKDAACGCCQVWVKHLEAHGFVVELQDIGNSQARARLGMPQALGSCHTALVAGYVIEGHVPARDIQRLLRQRPIALGLAVPGMPIGSPGMDGPEYGGRREAYEVLLVQRDGRTQTFSRHG